MGAPQNAQATHGKRDAALFHRRDVPWLLFIVALHHYDVRPFAKR
jgi:hypothetical protein